MNSADDLLGVACWLGAIVDRARRGTVVLAESWQEIDADYAFFGGQKRSFPAQFAEAPYPEALLPLVRALHAALRERTDEKFVWEKMTERVLLTPPGDVVEDLLARDVATLYMGHLPHADRLLFKYAEVVDEALLTLAKRRFLQARYTPSELEEVIHQFRTHEWMLWSLAQLCENSNDKSTIVARYVAAHPEWQSLVSESPEHFQNLVKHFRDQSA